jgi:hypothetical protein
MSSDALSDANKPYEDLVNAEIAEKRAKVERETQEKLARAARRAEEEKKAGIDEEAQRKRDNESAKAKEWETLSLGMNDTQKALLKDWLAIQQSIAFGQGIRDLEKLKTKAQALMEAIVSEGRNLGTIHFRPFTVYMSETGLLLIPDDAGKLKLFRGTFSGIALPSGEKDVELDAEGLPSKLFSYGHIANNIQIKQFYNVEISETKVEPVKTIPHKPLFPMDAEQKVRPLTKEERKQRKIVF